MSRYNGKLGVRLPPVETEPGILTQDIVELDITGDIFLSKLRWQSGELLQDTVTANHTISCIVPEELESNFGGVVYATWQNQKWSVRTIEYNRPRIVMSLGGIYNG